MPALLAKRPPVRDTTLTESPIHFFESSSQSVPTLPEFEGLRLYPDFLSESEAGELLETLETTPFVPAQSGKGKQHYGPRINFNKKRMNAATYRGVPTYSHDLEARMRSRIQADRDFTTRGKAAIETALTAFDTTDVFVLRYQPEEMSNLDFHLDDCFAYGELIADLSLESDSFLTFFRGRPNSEIDRAGTRLEGPICVRVELPARSLAVLYGPARFEWEHAILAYDIESQRTSVTLRTLSETLRATSDGRTVIDLAHQNVI